MCTFFIADLEVNKPRNWTDIVQALKTHFELYFASDKETKYKLVPVENVFVKNGNLLPVNNKNEYQFCATDFLFDQASNTIDSVERYLLNRGKDEAVLFVCFFVRSCPVKLVFMRVKETLDSLDSTQHNNIQIANTLFRTFLPIFDRLHRTNNVLNDILAVATKTDVTIVYGLHFRSIPEISIFEQVIEYLGTNSTGVTMSDIIQAIRHVVAARKENVAIAHPVLLTYEASASCIHQDSDCDGTHIATTLSDIFLCEIYEANKFMIVLHHGQNNIEQEKETIEDSSSISRKYTTDTEQIAHTILYPLFNCSDSREKLQQITIDGLYSIVCYTYECKGEYTNTVQVTSDVHVFTNGLPIQQIDIEQGANIDDKITRDTGHSKLKRPILSVWYDTIYEPLNKFFQHIDKEHIKAVVLLSGGLDSTFSLVQLWLSICKEHKKDLTVLPIYIDYGQKTRDAEYRNLKQNLLPLIRKLVSLDTKQKAEIFEPVLLDFLRSMYKSFTTVKQTSVLLSDDAAVKYTTQQDASGTIAYIPNRNSLLINTVAAISELLDFDIIVLGANLTDGLTYKDNTVVFIEQVNRLLRHSIQKPILVYAPLSNETKTQFVRRILSNPLLSSTERQIIQEIAKNTLSCRYAHMDTNGNIETCISRIHKGTIPNLKMICGPCSNKLIALLQNHINPSI